MYHIKAHKSIAFSQKLPNVFFAVPDISRGNAKGIGKALSEKVGRTPDEDDMLELLLNGGSRVSEENLSGVLRWYREH